MSNEHQPTPTPRWTANIYELKKQGRNILLQNEIVAQPTSNRDGGRISENPCTRYKL